MKDPTSNGSGTVFEPEDVKQLGSVFDDAWARVTPQFDPADNASLSAARTRLATIVIQLAEFQTLDAMELADTAVRRLNEQRTDRHQESVP
jgi:hypothetical protein